MRRHLLGVVCGLVLAFNLAAPASAITWGQLDDDGFVPEVGAIMVDFRAIGQPQYGIGIYCSGTLVHERVFLTAGHCAEGLIEDGITDANGKPLAPVNVWVSFDPDPSDFDPEPGQTSCDSCLDIEQIVNSPDYYWGPMSDPHDIAAIILDEPYTKVDPMSLPDEGELDDLWHSRTRRNGDNREQFLVAGYGASFVDPRPYFTEYLDKRQYGYSSFQGLLRVWLIVSQNEARDDEGTCYGDSGGPIIRVDENGSRTVVGVTSWGDTACAAMGMYYRADTAESLEFIHSVIDSVEGP